MSASALPDLQVGIFKNVLFATDFSPESMHALPWVVDLARKFGSNVHLCHIIPPNPLVTGAPEAAPLLYETERKDALEQLKTLAASAQLASFKPRTILTSGLIEDQLLGAVDENKIDLVVAGTHGRTGLRRLLLGSVVEGICRVATCPLLTVGPGLAPANGVRLDRILLPTDLSHESVKIVPFVREIALQYKAAVTVLHVLPEEVAANPDAKTLTEPIVEAMTRTFRGELKDCNPEFLIGFGGDTETILRTARAQKAGLIAMGIRNAFLPGVRLRSSTAYRIMAEAHCPVLTCR